MRPADGQVHLWRVGLDLPARQQQWLRQQLSPDELSRADCLLDTQRQYRFIACRGALRDILARYLATSPEQISIESGVHGKPLLAGRQTGEALTFNLSHSQNLALIAIASKRQIGIDLERIDPDLNFEPLARKVFSEGEIDALFTLPPPSRRSAFYRCWTLKEAYMKGTGQGFNLPPHRFEVSLAPPALISCPEGTQECVRWQLQNLPAPKGFAAAMAIEAPSQIDGECSILNYEF